MLMKYLSCNNIICRSISIITKFNQAVLDMANSSSAPVTNYSTSDLNDGDNDNRIMNTGMLILEDRCVRCGAPVVDDRMVCEKCVCKVIESKAKSLSPKTWY